MANRSTTARVTNKHGDLTLQQQETDSPIIPIAHLERLQTFKPEAVDWILDQTKIEAEYRRKEGKRINSFVFAERIIGQVFALLIGLAGIAVGGYVALHGQAWAGGTIASIAITGLAVVFLTGRSKK